MDIPRFCDLTTFSDMMFEKYFRFNELFGELKFLTKNNIEMNSMVNVELSSKKFDGSVGAKYWFDHANHISCYYNINKNLVAELFSNRPFSPNMNHSLMLDCSSNLRPTNFIIKNHYFNKFYNVTLDVDFPDHAPILSLGTVINLHGLSTGYFVCGELEYDTSTRGLAMSPKIGVGYLSERFSLWSLLQDKDQINTSICYIIGGARLGLKGPYDTDGKVILSSKFKFDLRSKILSLGLAGKFWLSSSMFIKMKWDQTQLLGVAFGYFATDELLLSCCGQINPRSVSARSLHIGLGATFHSKH